MDLFKPYYGIELGFHPLFAGDAFTFSGLCGIEKGFLSLETSLSHFIAIEISDHNEPYRQNLLNLKLGFQISKIRLKVGTSFLLNEHIPQGQARIGLLDIGKINGTIYGIEIQFKIE